MPPAESAPFTTKGTRPVVCQRCHESFEEGTQLFFMEDKNRENPGRHVCAGCRQYYLRKTERIQQSTSRNVSGARQVVPVTGTETRTKHAIPAVATTSASEQLDIRKAVAAAQRQGHNHPLRVGTSILASTGTGHTAQMSMVNRPWPKRSINNSHSSQSPVPRMDGDMRPIVLPKFMSDPESFENFGYQTAHLYYDEMRKFFARKASAEHQNEVVIIKFAMMTLKPGNRTPQIVSNLIETVSNIPLHIGVKDLKDVAYFTLLPPFSKWSKEFPLPIEDVRLRFKDWVELVHMGLKDKDIDAISSKFFAPKGKSKVLQFQPNKVLELYLELSHEQHLEILDYIENTDQSLTQQRTTSGTKKSLSYITENRHHKKDSLSIYKSESIAKTDFKKRLRSESQVSDPRPPPSLRVKPSSSTHSRPTMQKSGPSSPSADDVRRALQAQTAPPKKIVLSILNTKAIKCMVYPTAPITFTKLIQQSCTFDAINECTDPKLATLIYDPHAKQNYGSFKRTSFGRLTVDDSEPVLGHTPSIAIKQCWYKANVLGNRVVYDNHTQIVKLTAEINCLRWASALMDLVYDFIALFLMERDPPPFSIPEMRFVKSALVITDKSHDTFLLEEVIDDFSDGNFIKYIGNGSARPLDCLEGDEIDRAKFLSFCQHLQYVKTKTLAFVGDFQGGKMLLTDPQLITSPDTGLVFAEGNLSSTHSSFTTEHTCNYFCNFFQLEVFTEQADSDLDSEVQHQLPSQEV